VSQFRDAYDEFRRQGVEVATISVDSHHSHRVWAEQLTIRYPMLSDFNREFLQAYGVPERSVGLLRHVSTRSAFLVDAGGIVRYAWYQPPEGSLPPVEELLTAARELAGGSSD
jgi:peroxiredoxin